MSRELRESLFDDEAVPFSGGSSLEANFSAPYGGMSIDFTHMDKVLKLHADESVKAGPLV